MVGVNGGEPGGEPQRFHMVQPQRDLEANWEVDLAKKLEDYLLKICSGEITGSTEDDSHSPVNFAEAALLLQGSVQVYSRKVEYLYNLVLHALEFLSQRQQDQSEGTSEQPEQSASHAVSDEESDNFWVSDDIPVEARNCLDSSVNKETLLNHFVKPPANLVVLEGDCLDTAGDGNELESYLLATNDLYQDFILLDPCDAIGVDDYLKGDGVDKGQCRAYRGSPTRKTFLSPTRRSGGTAHWSSLGKNQDANVNRSPMLDRGFEANDCNMGPDPAGSDNYEDVNHGFDMDDRHSEPEDLDGSDDDDDPWKPLNPHEQGNLKVKPFRKVKAFRRNGLELKKSTSIATIFPLARLHGTVSPELTEIWESRQKTVNSQRGSQSPPLYEKLRQSLTDQGNGACNDFTLKDDNGDNGSEGGFPDFDPHEFDLPESMNMEEGAAFHHDKHNDGAAHFGTDEAFDHGDPSSQETLEDLCRSHLDALLASIAENEKQTELAARVSSWKQKIEQNLEEQESHPPFDIHEYGEKIIDKLSLEPENGNIMSFSDVVKGQEKHDVARTFSALLQLVNNGDVDLDRSGAQSESVCYTSVNTFHIRLVKHDRRRVKPPFQLSKRRGKSPMTKQSRKHDRDKWSSQKSPVINSASEYGSTINSSQPNCKVSARLGSIGGIRCTPDGKRRRRSRILQRLD
ncbi:hypothetical protein SLE2022_165550 [Rubroshorea leprosula]